jgi:hypothetical protein
MIAIYLSIQLLYIGKHTVQKLGEYLFLDKIGLEFVARASRPGVLWTKPAPPGCFSHILMTMIVLNMTVA